MFNIHRMLFLALKKVWMVKINPPAKFPIAPLGEKFPPLLNSIWKTLVDVRATPL